MRSTANPYKPASIFLNTDNKLGIFIFSLKGAQMSRILSELHWICGPWRVNILET